MSMMERALELVEIRKALGISQADAARDLDLTIREYQAFEWAEREIPDIYIMALERIALRDAVLRRDPMVAPASVREEALSLVKLIIS